jgi:hypothetical protein
MAILISKVAYASVRSCGRRRPTHTPVHHAEQLNRAIPHSRLRILTGAHMGASEYSDLYANEILQQLRGTDDT